MLLAAGAASSAAASAAASLPSAQQHQKPPPWESVRGWRTVHVSHTTNPPSLGVLPPGPYTCPDPDSYGFAVALPNETGHSERVYRMMPAVKADWLYLPPFPTQQQQHQQQTNTCPSSSAAAAAAAGGGGGVDSWSDAEDDDDSPVQAKGIPGVTMASGPPKTAGGAGTAAAAAGATSCASPRPSAVQVFPADHPFPPADTTARQTFAYPIISHPISPDSRNAPLQVTNEPLLGPRVVTRVPSPVPSAHPYCYEPRPPAIRELYMGSPPPDSGDTPSASAGGAGGAGAGLGGAGGVSYRGGASGMVGGEDSRRRLRRVASDQACALM
ncbi:unnamed protein product [Vitrella brassicaformis CCMP3155]|uniref:Uncharacterized protein n=2 Tax=Vitrella brassicaformis TaxID=1169539 RepID=A0A0G4EAG6_VITBC|nr:unnamed protein product [Vitrella brassicaformis CCMP3155]|eukprot:CEL92228.1 unnamed protein product [Vitrella brassicaformis CCMP3155]